MNLLLDTHAFVWVRTNDRRIEPARRAIIEAEEVFVSAASAWEVAIKQALGKLVIPEAFEAGVADAGFDELPISFRHARVAGGLPLHHRDPFDRMLIAQALCEDLTLITHDRRLDRYGARLLWL